MLTLVIRDRRRLFGQLVDEPFPMVNYSPLAQAIRHREIPLITYFYPMIEVYKSCLMPDHIHMIIRVNNELPNGSHLGHVVAGFKKGCNDAYRQIYSTTGGFFEQGYNDRLLKSNGHLKIWKQYLKDNPRRLSVKRQHPDLFVVRHDIEIGDKICHTVGNRFLLQNPDKEAVIVHSHDSKEEYQDKIKRWMQCGERGGVLVGTGISEREGWVMREAMIRGYKVIVPVDKGFGPYYKPSGEKFDVCARGDMLLICPWEHDPHKGKITRDECLKLNKLAEAIAAYTPSVIS